jgi:HEPN domain-containing protein
MVFRVLDVFNKVIKKIILPASIKPKEHSIEPILKVLVKEFFKLSAKSDGKLS